MDRQTTLDLFEEERRNKGEWNAWADKLMERRRALEASGMWQTRVLSRWDRIVEGSSLIEGTNDETKTWIIDATANFSTFEDNVTRFPDLADFRECIFPGPALFRDVEFQKGVSFVGANFSEFSATFLGSKFGGEAVFIDTLFGGDSYFSGCHFEEVCWFSGAQFKGAYKAANCVFNGPALFSPHVSQGGSKATHFFFYSDFRKARFETDVDFSHVTFDGNAFFDQATFLGSALFDNAIFNQDAIYSGIDSRRIFHVSNAHYAIVPDFVQADFSNPPSQDTMVCGNQKHDTGNSLPERWRSLKRLAEEARDYHRQHECYAREIVSARGVSDYPIHWRPASMMRFWSGQIYQRFFNFGRAVGRPVVLWTLTVSVFAFAFCNEGMRLRGVDPHYGLVALRWTVADFRGVEEQLDPCFKDNSPQTKEANSNPESYIGSLSNGVRVQTTASVEAWYLSLRNSLVIADGSPELARRALVCLYGIHPFNDNSVPYVPPKVGIYLVLERVISVALIFMFGLGLRNLLRMKS